jgi:hypothetical protein
MRYALCRSIAVLSGLVLMTGAFTAPSAAAAAACTVTPVAPARVAVTAFMTEIPVRIAADCPTSSIEYVAWDISGPRTESIVLFTPADGDVVDTWTVFDDDGIGSYRYHSGWGYTSDYANVVARDATTDIRFGSRVALAATRAGKNVRLAVTARRYSPSAEGFTAYNPGASGAQIQVSVDRKSWKALRSVKLNSGGSGSALVPASPKRYYRAVIADTRQVFGSTSAALANTSAKAPVAVLAAKARPAQGIHRGATAKVSGTLKAGGAALKASVQLQSRTSKGWKTLAKARTNSKGAVIFKVKPSRTTTYRLRFAGTKAVRAGASRAAGIKVYPAPQRYKNCDALNSVYVGGVKRTAAAQQQGGTLYYTQFVSARLYDLNPHLDRDKDRLACER